MPTAEYVPDNTTSSTDVTEPATRFSLSRLPDSDELIFVQAGFLPREQEYYWTEEWQTEERFAREEYAAGNGRRFETAEEAIRWLLSTDEE